MAALATADDVAVEMGLDDSGEFTDVQANRVPSLLIKASALFCREAGRKFAVGTYEHRVQVIDGWVKLLETPVSSVDSVVDDSGNTVSFTEHGDRINVSAHHHNNDATFSFYQPAGCGSGWFVTVTYTGGGVPDEVRVTVAQVAARHLNVDPVAASGVRIHDQTLGPISERRTYFDWAAETVALTAEECALAESFRDRTQRIVHSS